MIKATEKASWKLIEPKNKTKRTSMQMSMEIHLAILSQIHLVNQVSMKPLVRVLGLAREQNTNKIKRKKDICLFLRDLSQDKKTILFIVLLYRKAKLMDLICDFFGEFFIFVIFLMKMLSIFFGN